MLSLYSTKALHFGYTSYMKKLSLLLASLLFGTFVFAIQVGIASAADYTVTNTADSGAGSLRQAIIDANANVSLTPDNIKFNIAGAGVQTITIGATDLPIITDPVIIDGFTQPLSGASGTGGGGTAECGDLVPATLPAASNTPQNILIQIDGGNIPWTDYEQGIFHFQGGSDNSVVRGVSLVNAGGNSGGFSYISGISINEPTTSVTNVLIECNYLGMEADGTTGAGNRGSGVRVIQNSSNITIRNNLVSANDSTGIILFDATNTGSTVEENLLGTEENGLTPAASPFGNGNISTNYLDDFTFQRNISSSQSSFTSVDISYGTNSTVQNNYIGFNINQATIPSIGYGMFLSANDGLDVNNNLIGNHDYGVYMDTYLVNPSSFSNNTVRNNIVGGYIYGVSSASQNDIYNNSYDGINIGTTTLTNSNIYNNGHTGVRITGSGSVMKGNKVGLNGSGVVAANAADGVLIDSSSNDNTIGGNTAADRNVISGNTGNGVHIYNDVQGICQYSNTVSLTIGNYIGVDTSGNISAGYGNGGSGVAVNEINSGDSCGGGSVYKHVIGGDSTGQPNLIAGNAQDGIRVYQSSNENFGSDVFSVSVLPNIIYGNGNLGINLAADSTNTGTADTDLSPNVINNFLMSFPATNANYYINHATVNSATFVGNQVTVNYNLQANGVQDSSDGVSLLTSDLVGYRLDFYINDAVQDGAYSGYNQAKTHLGSFIVDGSESGATHTFTSPITPSAAQSVSVTTTVLWKNIPNPCPTPGRFGDGPPYSTTSCE